MSTTQNTTKKGLLKRLNEWIIAFLESLSDRLKLLAEVALINLYTILLLIIIYLFYWNFPQAKDLLLTMNQESHFQIALFFLSLITLAGICWYMPRFFYDENKEDYVSSKDLQHYGKIKQGSNYLAPVDSKVEHAPTERKSWKAFLMADMKGHAMDYQEETYDKVECYDKQFKEMIPRILATSLLFIVTLGILNVGNELGAEGLLWKIPAHLVLAVLAVLLLTILLFEKGDKPLLYRVNRWLTDHLGNGVLYYFGATGIVLTLLMLTKKGGLDDLPYLFFASFLLSLSFLVFAIFRRWIPFFKEDTNVRIPLAVMAVSLSLVFVLINLMPRISQFMNPLVCANLAFVFYLTLLYIIRLWGLRNRVSMVFFLIAGIFVLAGLTNSFRNHEVTYVPNKIDPNNRLTIEAYFAQWVEKRNNSIKDYLMKHPNDSFPIIIASAEGGGSRAAYWTTNIHAYLDRNIPGYYNNHLFALTGASGGSTGNCTYYAMKKGGLNTADMQASSDTMFTENYLSSSLTLLLGADLFKDVIGLPLGWNRAKQLEYEWTTKLQSLIGENKRNIFKEPFLELWYENNQLRADAGPLLFINMTQVQGAGHGIVSPVKLQPRSYKGIDLLDALYQVNPTKTINVVTANLLNASFPYINPAGQIPGAGSFVDAGYFDNYGARTAAGLLKELGRLRSNMQEKVRNGTATSNDSLYQRIKFISVLIRNGTADETHAKKDRLSNQLLAPVSTIGNIRTAVNVHNFWDLENAADAFYSINLKRVFIQEEDGKGLVKPVIPLARYLSPLAIKAMNGALDTLVSKEQSELRRLEAVLK
ncbi:MAG: hypothetical protein R2828_19020 [Saprospiraceae bacterium]